MQLKRRNGHLVNGILVPRYAVKQTRAISNCRTLSAQRVQHPAVKQKNGLQSIFYSFNSEYKRAIASFSHFKRVRIFCIQHLL